MSRTTAWRLVQRVMDRAGIEGPQASAEGLRHGFGIAMLSGDRPLPINVLRDLVGHTHTKRRRSTCKPSVRSAGIL